MTFPGRWETGHYVNVGGLSDMGLGHGVFVSIPSNHKWAGLYYMTKTRDVCILFLVCLELSYT